MLTVTNSAGSNTTTKASYIKVAANNSTTVLKPVANFTTNITSGTVPLIVAFTDKSTNSPTSWNWSFGDGTTNSTLQNPVHNYSAAGNYTVMLTATNSAGSNVTTKSNYIKVTANNTVSKPAANFTTNVTSGNVPLIVAFTDKSTGSPTAWNWSFGDGTTNSTVQNPVHNYSTAGNYTVILTVTNSAGSNSTTKASYIKATANNSITVLKPVVSFWGSRTSGTAPLTITFTDASKNTPTAWNWSFGDGTYSAVQKPRHIYSKAGTYTVTLTASNAAGSGTLTRSKYIKVT
jgi:PKD repeat protein